MSTSQLEEEQSRLAIESANLGLWEWDLISGEISFDERCYEILGLPSQTKAQYPDVMKVVHFADRPAVEAAFKRALDVQGNGQFNMEYRIVQPGGRQRWVATLGAVQFGGAGAERRATCYAGMIQDITRRKQNNLIVAREKEALQLIAQSAPLADVLELLTRTIEELSGGGLLSSILLLDPDGLHLRHGAAPSLPVSYTRAIDGLTIGPTVGSCGTAAYRGQTVVVKDIARDPLWADYRDLALSHGLRACWSRPILSAGGKVLGTFAVYYGASRDPTPEDLELVELLTHTAAVAIERVRSEEIVKTKTVRRDLLSEALEHLLSSQESDPVLRELFFKVARQMELDTYFNYAVDPDGGALTLRSYEGIPEETAEKIQRLEFGEAICGTVAQTLQPIIATDIQHSDEDKTALARSFGIQAFACYPLMSGARLLGTLAFASRTRLRFDDEELEFIRIISRYAAVAMERADIEQRLRESEAYFREMAQDLPIVVWIRLPNGNLDFVNNVWLDYTGQSLDYLRSSPDAWTAALHADDLERVKGIYTEGLRSGASYTMEARFRRASDGAYRWHLIRCVPLRDPVGKVVKFIGTSTDIEDMKRAEVALRASEEEFRALFERAGVGKSQVDCKTKRFLRVNPKLCDLLGYSAEDLCTLTVLDITHPDDREMTNALFEKLNRGEITEASLEKRYVRKDGAIVWAHVAATVVNNAAGEASRFLAVIQDVSQRKLAEAELQKVNEELENRVKARTADVMRVIAELSKQVSETDRLQTQLLQAQKMESIGTLAGGIAHDFNNLLNIISGYAAMIPENLTDPRKISEDIEVIHETVQRGGRLIQQLLAMTRKTDSKLEPVEINSMLRKLQILLRDTFPRTIDISLQLEPELPTILADPNQMNQVLLNLCVNARDAMPDGGELLLATATIGGAELRACFQDAEAERYACVKVTDTGPGIDPNTRNRIFEPFFTTKEQGRGTGLGLSVVYGIVGNHGGFVDVASEPGHGSTFSVYLPIPKGLSKGVENMEQGGNGNLENFTGNGETILVVEDEIRELQLLRNFLEGKGYRVLTAKDGIEAVETHLQHQNEIALVVLDLGLPKMNGWNAFKEMKKMDPHLNAIIATGHMPPQIQGEIAREMTDVVMKPYQLDRVLTTISQVIGKTETETKASPDL